MFLTDTNKQQKIAAYKGLKPKKVKPLYRDRVFYERK
jgi:hypothetical protein